MAAREGIPRRGDLGIPGRLDEITANPGTVRTYGQLEQSVDDLSQLLGEKIAVTPALIHRPEHDIGKNRHNCDYEFRK